jgi:membrane-associated phospholipid phosphatase
MVTEVFKQPYPLPASVLGPILALGSLVPCYVFIGCFITPNRGVGVPDLPLDRLLPLSPVWSVVYGSHLILVLLPFIVIRRERLLRRTVLAYLLIWAVALVCFLVYPTSAPRPTKIVGDGFVEWLLRIIYVADPPYNCFPPPRVAHTFVSAFACFHVHRGVGVGLGVWALLIGLSTLFTKQHYALDVIAGMGLATIAYWVFLRRPPPETVQENDRRVAPYVVLMFAYAYGLTLAAFWLAHWYLVRP